MTAVNSVHRDCTRFLEVGGRRSRYHSLEAAQHLGAGNLADLPFSQKCLAENLLRHEPACDRCPEPLDALERWRDQPQAGMEVEYRPARVLMPEISGLLLLNDLCAMREAMAAAGGDPT